MHALLDLDRELFLLINGMHAPWADGVMEAVSVMVMWFPMYAVFLYLIQRWLGWRGLGIGVLCITAMIFASDSGSVMLFKDQFQRLRPCHADDLQGMVHVVDGCGGQYGFVSSHAANHFAIAAFLFGVLRRRWSQSWIPLLLWAALIGYSRIYLGRHYPGDVIVGALYGMVIGAFFVGIFLKLLERKNA